MSTTLHPKYQGAEWTIYDVANSSVSKQKYSFPKSNRFKETMKILNDRVGYDLPSTLRTRGTSFGYGERSGNEHMNKCNQISFIDFYSVTVARSL